MLADELAYAPSGPGCLANPDGRQVRASEGRPEGRGLEHVGATKPARPTLGPVPSRELHKHLLHGVNRVPVSFGLLRVFDAVREACSDQPEACLLQRL